MCVKMESIQLFMQETLGRTKNTIVLVGHVGYTRLVSKLILETFERLHKNAFEIDAHSETYSRPTTLNAFTIGLLRQTCASSKDILIVCSPSYKEGPIDSENVRYAIDFTTVIEIPQLRAIDFVDFLSSLKTALLAL